MPQRRAARSNLLALIGFVGLCLLVLLAHGAVAAASGQAWLRALPLPPGTPPGWVYGPVWAVLYPLAGVSAWLVWRRIDAAAERKRAALRVWGWQLMLSALWAAALFGGHNPALALLVMAALLSTVAGTLLAFWRLQLLAAYLLIPYAVWLICMAYINTAFWWTGAS